MLSKFFNTLLSFSALFTGTDSSFIKSTGNYEKEWQGVCCPTEASLRLFWGIKTGYTVHFRDKRSALDPVVNRKHSVWFILLFAFSKVELWITWSCGIALLSYFLVHSLIYYYIYFHRHIYAAAMFSGFPVYVDLDPWPPAYSW